MKFRLLSTLFASVFSNCNMLCLYGAEPVGLTAKVASLGLIITNNTLRDVYYEIHEETILARIEWITICTNKNRILPKKSVRVPAHFKPSGKVHVFWWHEGKYFIDKIHYGSDEVKSFVIEKR